MTCYKATRPDGTDFQTGTVLYEIGTVVNHPASNEMVPNEPSTYLSVSTEKADCTGFKWPCRLFEVEPIGEVLDGLGASKHKRACLKLKVVRELPAWEALGPNGEMVAALIEKAKTMTPDQVEALYGARGAARDAAGYAAWDAARGAAGGAAYALVVKDLISEEHFNILYGPWKSVMEQP